MRYLLSKSIIDKDLNVIVAKIAQIILLIILIYLTITNLNIIKS
jgi:hypothetical protein